MHRISILVLALVVAGCGRQDMPVELKFEATLAGEPTACGSPLPSLSDLRFYVSDVELLTDSGAWVKAGLETVAPWQNDNVALVDLENGAVGCENGTRGMNSTVRVLARQGVFKGARFTVGVPFEVNHANPLIAESPLNDSAMHWHWRSGYKFLRAGLATEAGETWIHLGSTGCEGTIGNILGCTAPNRVIVQLLEFDPSTDRVGVDLSTLLDTAAMLELGDRTDCSSGPAETACRPPFAALGLEPEHGELPLMQRVFMAVR